MRVAPLSFRARLTLRSTVVFSCILAAASTWIFVDIRATTYADLDSHLRTLAGTEVTSAIDNPDTPPHVHELPVTALAGGTFTQKIVQILDENGRVVAVEPGQAQHVQLVAPGELEAALAGEAPVKTIDVDGVPVRLVVLRTTAEGKPYAVAVGVVIVDLLNGLNRLQWLLLLVWVVSTAATAAAGFALASTALTPVRRITERAMKIATTDVQARLEPSVAQDEIGVMTQSLNRLIERLHVALDANRRFAADAAHELRSPVTAIAGEIEVTLRRERSSAEYKDTLARVQDRLSSLSALITDLMVLVRAQEGGATIQPQELTLESIVDGSFAKLQKLAAVRRVTLRRGDMSGLLTYGEIGPLGRVFDNVLENAIRYNRENGSVVVEARFEDATSDTWAPSVISVRISDTGPGISAEEQERVFERFYRVDQSRNRHTGGAGLGLAIAREVLGLFKGSISIEQSSGLGTTVEIRLPGRRQWQESRIAKDETAPRVGKAS